MDSFIVSPTIDCFNPTFIMNTIFVDARELFEVYPTNASYQCIGYAPSQGRKCRNPINQENRRHAQVLLDRLSRSHFYSPALGRDVDELCLILHCVRWHRNQAPRTATQWKASLRTAISTTWLASQAQMWPGTQRAPPAPSSVAPEDGVFITAPQSVAADDEETLVGSVSPVAAFSPTIIPSTEVELPVPERVRPARASTSPTRGLFSTPARVESRRAESEEDVSPSEYEASIWSARGRSTSTDRTTPERPSESPSASPESPLARRSRMTSISDANLHRVPEESASDHGLVDQAAVAAFSMALPATVRPFSTLLAEASSSSASSSSAAATVAAAVAASAGSIGAQHVSQALGTTLLEPSPPRPVSASISESTGLSASRNIEESINRPETNAASNTSPETPIVPLPAPITAAPEISHSTATQTGDDAEEGAQMPSPSPPAQEQPSPALLSKPSSLMRANYPRLTSKIERLGARAQSVVPSLAEVKENKSLRQGLNLVAEHGVVVVTAAATSYILFRSLRGAAK